MALISTLKSSSCQVIFNTIPNKDDKILKLY